MSVRSPAVAGAFYPADETVLRRRLGELCPAAPRARALCVLVPHAGYDYSGATAGAVFSRVEVTPDVVLLSFSHRGTGRPVALWTEGAWRTPLGAAPVATELVDRIRAAFPRADVDEPPFLREHSGEVQVPFLQHARPDARIAPVSLNTMDPILLRDFGTALATVAGDALVVATTDLTHCGAGYGVAPPAGKSPKQWANEQDGLVLDRVRALDEAGFWRVVMERDVTMCGVAPTAAMIAYARARGAASAEVVRYATSADDEPDADRVVGYPGVVVYSPTS